MNNASISIIIPAKNEEGTIAKVLNSVFDAINKVTFACEVILIDNDSTDMTATIAKKCGCKVVKDSSNTISKLRNVGGRIARGGILAFLDADCVVDPMWISHCIESFSDPRIAIVGTRAIPDLNSPTWVERAWYNLFTGTERSDFPDWLGTSNIFVLKEAFDKCHGFNELLETAEDVDFCRRVRSSYLIYLEKRVNTIHLRESKTLHDLYKRELRRGKFSLRHFLKCKEKSKDFMSTFMPLFFAMITVCLMVSIMANANYYIDLFLAMLLMLMPVALIIKKRALLTGVEGFVKVYIVSLAYIVARSASACHEIYILVTNKT